MATVKATNPVTGKQFDINEAEFATTYKPLGWTLSSGGSATNTSTPTQGATSSIENKPVVENKPVYGQDLTTSSGQTISSKDPSYSEYASQMGVVKTEETKTTPEKKTEPTIADQSNIDPTVLAKPGIANLINSQRVFNEEDAKNFAYAKGETNYQQYIGSVGGQTNPLYIGATNWSKLQKQYTPYQLQQATIRTKDGIYWNQNVNIGDIPAVDPSTQINADTKKISDIVSSALDESKSYSKKDEPEITESKVENEETIMSMLKDEYGYSAETLYNELFKTPEMETAQSEVNTLKAELDKYDQQLDELKNDILAEVEGEATDSYISALATVRGDKILKMKRSTQRDYDTALANYNGLRENANNLLQVRLKDSDNRYNRLFSMLQLQIQQEGTAFNQELALNQMALQIPEGRSMTIAGTTVTGLKENDNLNVVQFTEADGSTYVIGVDKKTGQQTYKTYIGKAKVSGSGSGTGDQTIDLNTALYWLSLVKNDKGGYDLNSIPAEIRTAVVNTISANKDNLPEEEKKSNVWTKIKNWWSGE